MQPTKIIANISQGKITTGGSRLTANTAMASVPTSAAAFTSSNFNYYMSGLIPGTPDLPDSQTLAYFFRDIYLYDNVAGSCVDIQSVFPFSDFELRGQDEKTLAIYNEALDRLTIRELLPQLSTAYLTDGFYAGSLVYDPRSKNFMDVLTHDALQCSITPSPFNNVDPTIRVSTSGPTLRFLNSTSEYARQYVESMPETFVSMLQEGNFVLDPLTTLFVGRKTLSDRAYVSYLQRILPMYLIEKSMYRGTLIESQRRQRAMSHISAGDDLWTPTQEELMMYVQQFQMAENDPLGGWVSTRNAVQIQDLRPGGDFWKWFDVTDIMTPYKLRALGVSEALLSGDSSYAAAESAYSTYLETVNGYRTHLTNMIFYRKLFPLLAVANNLFKDPTKKVTNVKDFLFSMSNKSNLRMPILHWHKDLTAKAEDNMMDLLDKLSEKGVPIPLKMWLASAGVDKETLLRDAKEDRELKKALASVIPGFDPDAHAGGTDTDSEFEEDSEFSEGAEAEPEGGNVESRILTSAPNRLGLNRTRMAFMNREFDSHEMVGTTRTGKPKAVFNQTAKIKDHNWTIAKIAARMATDPSYRMQVAKANYQKLGATRVRGF